MMMNLDSLSNLGANNITLIGGKWLIACYYFFETF